MEVKFLSLKGMAMPVNIVDLFHFRRKPKTNPCTQFLSRLVSNYKIHHACTSVLYFYKPRNKLFKIKMTSI